ncbi:MAG: FAD-dependent oxidoreductase [Vicinamibacterales bacterium]|jgi:glycine/D-amino acid oxidase-like deaminating enzyme
MDRRSLLKFGGLAAVGFAAEACAPRTAAKPQVSAPKRPPVRLALVNASWDRVIRTTIGLRPHRPSGFVLKADKLDNKTIIHNFGHGGSGMSLSWGTASMATDLALPHTERRAAVLGSGVVGLTTARELQRHGFEVTIYAATVPPDTTSNMSLAGFTPTSGLVDFKSRTAAWDAQFQQAVVIAYRRLQLLIGPKYGVTWIMNYAPTDNAEAARGSNVLLPESVQGSRQLLQPGEHPFPTKYAIERPEMRIEPSIYLDALMNDFLLWGGKVVIRKFETPRDITALSENVIVNCTGLGAKALFNDPELVPLKGQLVVLTPQAEVNYGTSGGSRSASSEPGVGIHMMARSDGIILGGTSQRDVWTLDVDEKERARVVEGHIELFNAMRGLART